MQKICKMMASSLFMGSMLGLAQSATAQEGPPPAQDATGAAGEYTDEELAIFRGAKGSTDVPAELQESYLVWLNQDILSRARASIPYAPTHAVEGYSDRLYNSFTAEQINTLIYRAQRANQYCDKDDYDAALQAYSKLSEDVGKEAQRENRRAEFSFAFFGAPYARDSQATYDAIIISRNFENFPAFNDGCGRNKKSDADPAFTLKAGVSYGEYDWRQAFLGQEPIGATAPLLDQVEVQHEIDAVDYFGSVKYVFTGDAPFSYAEVSVGYSEASGDAAFGTFDPTSDNRFLLPGPEGGASGLSLGDAPSFPNTATDLAGDFEFDELAIDLGLPVLGAQPLSPEENDSSYLVELVLGGSFADYKSSFSGRLDGYSGNFNYATDVKVDALYVGARFEASVPLTSRTTTGLAIAAWFGGEGRVSTFDVSGIDTLNWAVFGGGTTGGGSADFDENQIEIDGSLSAGLRLFLQPAIIDIFAEVETVRTPSIIRNGNDPSTARLDDTTRTSVGVSLTIPIG